MDPAQVRARETASAARNRAEAPDSTFEDLLDIVNPLQHLPVVGTLYRAISGDKIGALPKIAGDALYGGLWGAVSALADTAFAAITGRDFGSTVLALVTDGLGLDGERTDDAPVRVAENTPPQALAAEKADGETAFSAALTAKGLDTELASRAMYAYRRSQGLVPAGLN